MIFESSCSPESSSIENTAYEKLSTQSKNLFDRGVTPEQMTNLLPQSTSDRLETSRREKQELEQIFLFVNSAGLVNQAIKDNQSIKAALVGIRNRVAAELRLQGFAVVEVPTGLELAEAIAWIKRRADSSDVALTIQTDAFLNPDARGTTAFYLAGNQKRQQQAERLLQQILTHVPTLVSRGVRPDTEAAFGNLPFARQIAIPGIVLTLGFSTNPLDRAIILNRSQAIAQGIATGLALSNRTTKKRSTAKSLPPKNSALRPNLSINISLNGKACKEQGVIIEENAYIPIALLDRLTIAIASPRAARLLTYNNTTYIRAIDLRGAGVSVDWNSANRTAILQSAPRRLSANKVSRIMGRGYLSKDTLKAYLQQTNPQALRTFPQIVELYLEEASMEGVNSDIAFTQALVETNFFHFGGKVQPSQNNFAALGDVGVPTAATFPNARTGVRAHVQLLKVYASLEPFVQDVVTPRFRFIARGIAPRLEQLSLYYSTDPFYSEKILAALRQLYQYQLARSSISIG